MSERDTPQQPEPDERRLAPRFGAKLPLDVDGVKAKLTDLSATGVGFVSEQAIEPGSSVEIGIRHLPDDKHPPPLNAEVVRVTPAGEGFAVGARLGPADDKDKGPAG